MNAICKHPSFDLVQLICKLVAIAILVAIFAGCTTSGAQPAKSQTQNFDNCTFNLTFPPGAKEGTIEVANQNQYLESSGNESYAPSATPTLDVKPDTTVTLSRTGATADGLTTLVTAGINALRGIGSKSQEPGTMNQEPTCPDGNCADDPHCPDGNCEVK